MYPKKKYFTALLLGFYLAHSSMPSTRSFMLREFDIHDPYLRNLGLSKIV